MEEYPFLGFLKLRLNLSFLQRHWQFNDEPTGELTLKARENEHASLVGLWGLTSQPAPSVRGAEWRLGTRLQDKLSILEDWATALDTRHAIGVVHGNLTPDSVGVHHGKGTLLNQGPPPDRGLSWTGDPLDDDVHSARWTATELFRPDDGDPHPTKMSDVYSFGCIMLQALTGCVPYCGTKRPEQVVYLKYLGREPIDAKTPKIADRYVHFMRLCWSLEPEKRPTMENVVCFIHDEIKKLEEVNFKE